LPISGTGRYRFSTLLDYHHQPHRKATNGEPGKGDLHQGKNGENLYLPVPVGTVIKDTDGDILHDMVSPHEEVILAHGGTGGAGKYLQASPKRKRSEERRVGKE